MSADWDATNRLPDAVVTQFAMHHGEAGRAATATVQAGDRVIVLQWVQRREPAGHRSTRWTYTDPAGDEWKLDYGYDGRDWCLFGPGGSPWGKRMWSTTAKSLTEASKYIAAVIAKADTRAAARLVTKRTETPA